MTNSQIKEYLYSLGETARGLHDIEYLLYKTNKTDEALFEKRLSLLVTFMQTHEHAESVIIQLSQDGRTDIREIAAALINYLWCYWMYLPYESNNSKKYEKTMRQYAQNLSWTIPLIKKFILDKAEGPVVISLYNIWKMDYAQPEQVKLIRDAVLSITKHKSLEVRKAIVRTLSDYYPSNDEALRTLDKWALQFYIDATYDADEQLRDWALYELWSSVENLNNNAATAFTEAFNRESPESEAYIESVVGMARMGLQYDRIEHLTVANLSQDGCGTGWIDSAEQLHSSECLAKLVDLYERIIGSDHNDYRLQKLEIVLIDWND